MNLFLKTMIFIMIIPVFSCSENGQKRSGSVDTQTSEQNVLAIVNDSPVTEADFELVIQETIGEKNASKLGESGRKKVLESLVASRAISQESLRMISDEERTELEQKVKAYREKILVQVYIAKNASPDPVSQEMVKDYYEKNPERFGARTEKVVEMMSTSRALSLKERDMFISACNNNGYQKDIGKLADALKKKGLPVFYNKQKAVKGLLHEDLFRIVKRLKKGEKSELVFVKEKPYLLRITDVIETEPKPLSEVSYSIRKSLAPVQLKKAVKKISEDILAKSKVEYR